MPTETEASESAVLNDSDVIVTVPSNSRGDPLSPEGMLTNLSKGTEKAGVCPERGVTPKMLSSQDYMSIITTYERWKPSYRISAVIPRQNCD